MVSVCHGKLQYQAGDQIQWRLNSPSIPFVFDSLLGLKTKNITASVISGFPHRGPVMRKVHISVFLHH